MTTVDFKLSLSEKLRREADQAGLLTPKAIERLLRDEIRRRRVNNFFAAAERLAGQNAPRMTGAEIESEIRKARRTRTKTA